MITPAPFDEDADPRQTAKGRRDRGERGSGRRRDANRSDLPGGARSFLPLISLGFDAFT